MHRVTPDYGWTEAYSEPEVWLTGVVRCKMRRASFDELNSETRRLSPNYMKSTSIGFIVILLLK